jgi:hypothetical protein
MILSFDLTGGYKFIMTYWSRLATYIGYLPRNNQRLRWFAYFILVAIVSIISIILNFTQHIPGLAAILAVIVFATPTVSNLINQCDKVDDQDKKANDEEKALLNKGNQSSADLKLYTQLCNFAQDLYDGSVEIYISIQQRNLLEAHDYHKFEERWGFNIESLKNIKLNEILVLKQSIVQGKTDAETRDCLLNNTLAIWIHCRNLLPETRFLILKDKMALVETLQTIWAPVYAELKRKN